MPDLKKLITLEALQAALPSWLKSSSKPSYTADEISDTNTANKFVTSTDKSNWNAKGTYSKPAGGIPKTDLSSLVQSSLDKADSAVQTETDPTVPTWAKQTNKPSYTQDEVADGSTYKRVTQTEKNAWSGKQNALTTTQMQAVNSGIDSTKVGQISTNQTNILYAIDTGVRNICTNAEYSDGTKTAQNTTFTTLADGTVTVKTPSGQTSTTNTNNFYNVWFVNSLTVLIPEGTWMCKLYGTDISNIRIEYAYTLNGTSTVNRGNFGEAFEIVIPTGVTASWLRICAKPSTSFNSSFKIVVCDKTVWDTYTPTEYVPPALPNYDLTYLQAEDRAALAEEIDAGAKNLWDFANAAIPTNSNPYGATYTKNDSAVTVTSINAWGRIALGTQSALKAETYVFRCKISNYSKQNGDPRIYIQSAVPTGTVYSSASVPGNGTVEIPFTLPSDGVVYVAYYGNFSDVTGSTDSYTASENMICTKAAFGVSQKFVPYRLPYDDVQSKTALLMNNMGGLTFHGSDLNTLVAGGRYLVNNATDNPVSNAPYNSWQTIEVFQSDYSTYPKVYYQIATDVTGATVTSKWRRRVYNSGGQYNAWTAWSS